MGNLHMEQSCLLGNEGYIPYRQLLLIDLVWPYKMVFISSTKIDIKMFNSKFKSMFQIDKVAHFGLGGMITAMMAIISILQEPLSTLGVLLCPIIGHVCVFIISVIKEYVVDGNPNWHDVWAAMTGSFVVHIFVLAGVSFSA